MICKEKNLFQEVEVSFKFSSDDNPSVENYLKIDFAGNLLKKYMIFVLGMHCNFITNSAWIYIEFTRDRNKITSTLF
jgi:hypothetical protein